MFENRRIQAVAPLPVLVALHVHALIRALNFEYFSEKLELKGKILFKWIDPPNSDLRKCYLLDFKVPCRHTFKSIFFLVFESPGEARLLDFFGLYRFLYKKNLVRGSGRALLRG